MKSASKTNQSAGKLLRISYQITSNATTVTNAGKFGLRACLRAWSRSTINHSGHREETGVQLHRLYSESWFDAISVYAQNPVNNA